MSLFLKGVEMPKEGTVLVIDSCGEVWSNTWPTRGYIRVDKVKAVEVLTPHGRLGDLDRLYKHIKAECNIYGKPTIGEEDGNKVLKIIANRRTIIEAEESE